MMKAMLVTFFLGSCLLGLAIGLDLLGSYDFGQIYYLMSGEYITMDPVEISFNLFIFLLLVLIYFLQNKKNKT